MRALLLTTLLLCAAPLAAQTYTGTLGPGSAQRPENTPYDPYEVPLVEGQKVSVRLNSDAFDTYLIVSGPGEARYENDDNGSTSESLVEFVALVAGTYTVWASAYDATGEGIYTLVVTPGAVAQVETVEGRLDPNDPMLPKGEHADTIERAITVNAPFDLELVSYGFDGYLAVQSPSGVWYRNDDAGDTMHSRIADLAPEAGTWRIIVTSAGAEAFGAYDLRILTYSR